MLHRVSVPLLAAMVVMPGYAVAQLPPSPAPASPPTVTTVLPANTPGIVLFSTNAAAWQELNRFNPIPPELMQLFLASPFFGFGIDPTQDIQPWLGDKLAIALLPATSPSETVGSSAVLLVPVKDAGRRNAFVDKLKTLWRKPEVERTYKGVTLLEWLPPSPPAGDTPPPDAPAGPGTPPAPTPRAERVSPAQKPHRPSPLAAASGSRWVQAGEPTEDTAPVKPTPKAAPSEPSSDTPAEPPGPKVPEAIRSQKVAIALLPNALVVAQQGHALEKLIDAQAGTSLAQNPLFQRTLQHPQFQRSLAVSYGNIGEAIDLLLKFPKPSLPSPPSPSTLQESRQWSQYAAAPPNLPLPLPSIDRTQLRRATSVYNTIDGFVWVQPEGVHSQANLYYTAPQPQLATTASPQANQILARLPAATYLAANGRNFKRDWEQIRKGILSDSASQSIFKRIQAGIRSATGLDLDTDLIAWMDGEYVSFLFPTKQGLFNYISPNLNLGAGLMLQTSDRPAAEAALRKLESHVRSFAKGEVTIVPRRVKGHPFVSWEGKDRGKIYSVLSYGWVGADTLVVTTGAGPMTELNPQPYVSLPLTYTFKTATESLPTPNDGYLYINMGASLSFLYGLILPYVPNRTSPFVQEVQRVLGTVRSISSTSLVTPDKQQIDSLWVLGPTRRP